jgi:soluble lytic murein transglycosylase-like protein
LRAPFTAASTLADWHRGGAGSQARRAFILLLTGLVGCASPIAASAQAQPPERTTAASPYGVHIAEAAERFGIPRAWIKAVMSTESAGNSRAVSPKGAMGLMQIMPQTWTYLRGRHGLGRDPFDVRDNILAGAAYLRELFDRYGSPGFLAAYNAGPARYEASLAGHPLPAETRAYVAAIAPTIGAVDLGRPVKTAATDPLVWTHAPLFAVQQISSAGADHTSAALPPDSDPAAIAKQNSAPTTPEISGLFIARTQPGVEP